MAGAEPAARARRFTLLALGALAAAAGGAWALSGILARGSPAPARTGFEPPTRAELDQADRAERELARTETRGLERVTVIAPEEARLDPATGEAVRRFEGFGLSVESTPPGARVIVNGQALGETPLVAGVSCTPGATVEVRLTLPAGRAARRTTTCRENTLVELKVPLGP
jgi:hypothetical protein